MPDNTLNKPGPNQFLKHYVHPIDPTRSDKCASTYAKIAPGAPRSLEIIDIYDFHCFHAHTHDNLTHKTARRLRVQVQGKAGAVRGVFGGERTPTASSKMSTQNQASIQSIHESWKAVIEDAEVLIPQLNPKSTHVMRCGYCLNQDI